ncbi:hypothetical protein AWB67_07295 [Caballeronia terrestris]|jgi:hypothetical protein|uniref:Uncharacterized protein n=1 Tax=Caballeronia terrestris TaxID=1226301 RepID=A0A158L0G8_9BURK|nr:hypothetical protein AWB67_07295 [Caballeronia terrestris]
MNDGDPNKERDDGKIIARIRVEAGREAKFETLASGLVAESPL